MNANKFLKDRIGIYGIRNIVNNKIYVGKTKCMYRRCHQYLYAIKKQKTDHINQYLLNAINKIGVENFEFFPLQFSDIPNLESLELAWMFQLKSTHRNFGYNLRMDSSTGMVTSAETSAKISNNLRNQWANGDRSTHGKKLKQSWKNNPQRRKNQSELFSQIKTKYEYKIHHPNGKIEKCYYNRLVELGLKNVIATFCQKNSNDVKFKGFRIIRYSKGES